MVHNGGLLRGQSEQVSEDDVLNTSAAYLLKQDTGSRPHQGIAQHTPIPSPCVHEGSIQYHDVLGGILRDYHRKVA